MTPLSHAMLSAEDLQYMKDIELGLRSRVAAKRASVMIFTVIVYDIITTIDREVYFVWKGRRTFAKVIFMMNRYLAPIGFGFHLYMQNVYNPSPEFCRTSVMVDLFVGIILCMIATMVIMLQVWALYNRSKLAFCLILGSYIACIAPACVMVGSDYLEMTRKFKNHQPTLNLNYAAIPELSIMRAGCRAGVYPTRTYALFVSSLVWESVLFIAMLWRVFYWNGFREGVTRHLYIDGLIYYIGMLIILIAGIITSLGDQLTKTALASGFLPGLKSIMVSHLLLRLKGFLVASSPHPEMETTQAATTTNIRFAPNRRSTVIPSTTFCMGQERTLDEEHGQARASDVDLAARTANQQCAKSDTDSSTGYSSHIVYDASISTGLQQDESALSLSTNLLASCPSSGA